MERFYFEKKDFLDHPRRVREFALQRDYVIYDSNKVESGVWSGFRSSIDNNEAKEIVDKIQKLTNRTIKSMNSCFHLNTKSSMQGFPHVDNNNPYSFAGVIYLSTDFPESSGTTIYEDYPEKEIEKILEYDQLEIMYCAAINSNNKIKNKFSDDITKMKNDVLKKIISFEFEFNKMICYSANYLHSPDNYFGFDINDGRLTIAFHGEFYAN